MTEWAVGLIGADSSKPSGAKLLASLVAAERTFDKVGLKVTHLAWGGDSSDAGKYYAVTSSKAKKMISSCFEGASSLSMISTPTGTKSPAYDHIALLTLSWNHKYETILCAVFSEHIAPFFGTAFKAVLSELINISNWSSGYGFTSGKRGRAEVHVLGGDSGDLTESESAALWEWYSTDVQDRRRRIRDVYPVLLLKDPLLNTRVGNVSMLDFIQTCPKSTWFRLGDFLVWRIPDDQVVMIRRTLSQAGILIATGKD
jgi:hypothetical protein